MKSVIFDLDGTLADITHRLKFIKCDSPDWVKFHKHCIFDKPKPEIIHLFKALKAQGNKMFIVSGRNDTVRTETLKWLQTYGIEFDFIVMRKANDRRPDDELKELWLNDGHLGPKEDILFTVDDRQRVVDMWRKNGLTCLQVDAWKEE